MTSVPRSSWHAVQQRLEESPALPGYDEMARVAANAQWSLPRPRELTAHAPDHAKRSSNAALAPRFANVTLADCGIGELIRSETDYRPVGVEIANDASDCVCTEKWVTLEWDGHTGTFWGIECNDVTTGETATGVRDITGTSWWDAMLATTIAWIAFQIVTNNGGGTEPLEWCDDITVTDLVLQYRDTFLFQPPTFLPDYTWRPNCSSFDTWKRSDHYPHEVLTVGNTTAWSILKPALLASRSEQNWGLEWFAYYSGDEIREVTSAYRTPRYHRDLTKARGLPHTKGSRHMFGDGVDLKPDFETWYYWSALYQAAQEAHADYIEPDSISGYDHVHADWRNH